MPIRAVKPRSDRGSIKNIASPTAEEDVEPATPFELRLKQLYETSQVLRSKELQSASGFITTDYIADKNAIPLSAYRLRNVVSEIMSKNSVAINQLSQQMSGYIQDEIGAEAIAYITGRKILQKVASVRPAPSFWRANKS